ncbi:Twitching motility protein PilT [Candidatus Desulfarcum epimagneticum]|uniref:Twitching motility protein PilT n=1 Tax=uncultured Desulfobacteraceae bacterium TaxID=218296 RepID=A0A484HIL9_9BACT|nr:Twitching motility protein PilT [uncultured Desulfobacteraceae bacterium]
MKAIDTNVLIRFLIADDEPQTQKAYSILKNAELKQREIFVPLLVVLEMIWVLESVYEIPRMEILESIRDLLAMPALKFEQHSAVREFVRSARGNSYDLSDLLIAHSARFNGCGPVLTFDKAASKFKWFERLT